MISIALHPASAKHLAAALRNPCALHRVGDPAATIRPDKNCPNPFTTERSAAAGREDIDVIGNRGT